MESLAVPVEIERKFLLVDDGWKAGVVQTRFLKDGLLARFGEGKVRIRHGGDRAWITVKGPRSGITRAEFDYEIPLGEAEEILSICELPPIEKVRHIVPYHGLSWAVDIHQGLLTGVEFAEVELEHPEQPIVFPPWVGEEVTNDPCHRKATLLRRNADLMRKGS